MMETAQLVTLAGLAIGLVYGAVGLLSGFCLMSSMRGVLGEGDGRLVRSYALAVAVAILASQLLAGRGTIDLGKSIYLQPTFSVSMLFLGGLLFGYGMVLSNGCGSRALVLLGRGNLRSFVVVIVLAIAAQMTLKGLVAPARIAMVQATQTTLSANSLPLLASALGLEETIARMLAVLIVAGALAIFSFAHGGGARIARRRARGLRAVRPLLHLRQGYARSQAHCGCSCGQGHRGAAVRLHRARLQ